MAIITFITLEPGDREYFKHELQDHTLHFIEASDPVPQDTEVLSLFVNRSVNAELLDALPKLRLIACRSTGYDNVDLTAAKEKNVTVVNVPSYGSTAVGEFTFLLLLALTRKLKETLREAGTIPINRISERGTDLAGKTIGIIGTGNIGMSVATIAKGFAMNVIANDINPRQEQAEKIGFTYVSLENLLTNSDIVSVHAPSTKETYHLISAERLALMHSGSILINTARGDLVDTKALVAALQSGHLQAAGLDVVEEERTMNQPSSPLAKEFTALREHPGVIITNHNAFNSQEAVDIIYSTTCKNILAFLDHKPENVVS